MITIAPGYRVGDQWFPTIQQAQEAELTTLLSEPGVPSDGFKLAINRVVEQTDEVVAILTCQPKSKAPRKPRSDIGKKRAAKDVTATHT